MQSSLTSLLNTLNSFFENIPDTVRRYRALVWTSFILCNIFLFTGLQQFKIDMTLESYFPENDPIKQAYDSFRAEFGSDEAIVLVFEAKDGDIFSYDSLSAIRALEKVLSPQHFTLSDKPSSQLSRITDTKSIVSAPYMESSNGDLISRQFIGDQLPTNERERNALKTLALDYPGYQRVYFSDDFRFGAIIVKTDFGLTQKISHVTTRGQQEAQYADLDSELDEGLDEGLDEELDEELADIDTDYTVEDSTLINIEGHASTQPDHIPQFQQPEVDDYAIFMDEFEAAITKPAFTDYLSFYPVGNPPVMNFFKKVIMKDLELVASGSLLIIAIVLWILFRSFSAVVWPIVIVTFSMTALLGIIGWSGVIMTMMINIIAFLILAVGVADAIHILSGYLYFRDQQQDHETALRSVFKKSGLACFLTSLTTAIGLMALVFVPLEPIKTFGLFAAIGVEIAFLLTMIMLPLMLDLWPPVKRQRDHQRTSPHLIQQLLQKVDGIGCQYPKTVVAIFGGFAALMLIYATQVKIDSNLVESLPHDSKLYKSFQIVNDELSGAQTLEILFDAGRVDAFIDPDLLNRMEKVELYLHNTYPNLVANTTSLVSITKSSYKALYDNAPEMYKIPQDPNALAQTLFLYNNANSEERRSFVSDDYSKARMTVTVKNEGSHVYAPLTKNVQAKVDDIFEDTKNQYPQLDITVTGNLPLMVKLMDYISRSQIQSFGIALLVISILLFFVFGSLRIGFIALVPNLLPIVTVFGIMGYFNISLDTDTLLIAPVIIGIVVDDTIHFLTHYRAGIQKENSISDAVAVTIREAGQALTFTTLVLSLGFLVFIFSSHLALQSFGILSAVAIFVALITDIFLLPALCQLANANFRSSTDTEKAKKPTLQQHSPHNSLSHVGTK